MLDALLSLAGVDPNQFLKILQAERERLVEDIAARVVVLIEKHGEKDDESAND
jgi:hypothetical protein